MKLIGKNVRTYWFFILSFFVVIVTVSLVPRSATSANPNDAFAETEPIMIIVGESKVVGAPWPTIRVAVTDPRIANVQVLTPDQVLLQGTKVGSTDLIMWNEDESQIFQRKVRVSLDVSRHLQKLCELFPLSSLELDQSEEVLIVKGLLRKAEQVVQLHDYLDKIGIKYVDMTSVAGVQQVQLQIRIAEVSRTAIRALGINATYADDILYGLVAPTSYGGTPLLTDVEIGPDTASGTFSPAVTVMGGVPRAKLDVFLQALAENQYLRVLANPTLVALSGEEASFLAGGEFPIPVVQENSDSITIEYKEFGVRLAFRPIVLGDNTIQLYVAPEVSDLTDLGSVTISGFTVKALKTRKAETTLELKSGQTFAMAGLIKINDDAITSRLPGIGDLPVIGPLFRSIRYTRGETELVVLVTASLVEPMNLAAVPPLPGFLHVQPDDWEFYLEGRIEGKEPAKINPADADWLREIGIDQLLGPGAWDRYDNPVGSSRADITQEEPSKEGSEVESMEVNQ